MARREVIVTTHKTICDQCHEPVVVKGKRVVDRRTITVQTEDEAFDLDFCDDACLHDWRGEHHISAAEVLSVRSTNHEVLALA